MWQHRPHGSRPSSLAPPRRNHCSCKSTGRSSGLLVGHASWLLYNLALNNQHRSAIIAAGGIADLQAALEVHTNTSIIRDAITKALQRLGAASSLIVCACTLVARRTHCGRWAAPAPLMWQRQHCVAHADAASAALVWMQAAPNAFHSMTLDAAFPCIQRLPEVLYAAWPTSTHDAPAPPAASPPPPPPPLGSAAKHARYSPTMWSVSMVGEMTMRRSTTGATCRMAYCRWLAPDAPTVTIVDGPTAGCRSLAS